MKFLRVLIDLDEVLADFIGGASKLWGVRHRSDLEKCWEIGIWDMVPPLDRCVSQDKSRWYIEVNEKTFWERIDMEGEKFWATLPALPWCYDLIRYVNDITTDWYIVTSPSYEPSCYSGKARWLKERLGKNFKRFIPFSDKHILAGDNVVLIDDHDLNITNFREAGGYGIVFPTYHNTLYYYRENPLRYVLDQLHDIAELPHLRRV